MLIRGIRGTKNVTINGNHHNNIHRNYARKSGFLNWNRLHFYPEPKFQRPAKLFSHMSKTLTAAVDISSLTRRDTVISIVIIGVLFFIFGFVSWVNAILIPYFKIACELTHFQAYLVMFAFYISYFIMSVPSSYLLKRPALKKE